ncbi:hypothetical protein [Litorilituus lipolyticus]|uniref:DUF3718 domain-containing protein n=1 Tax=Litorilituus lipolyticus TaxID=2491017 RepID=A0A502KPN6_9GAMM|nr:hypothetical protein [Litorilituus lipolyticus]TPH12259.1 hypothetical protein EPA86_18120 [Litorilituus lipolyticus]
MMIKILSILLLLATFGAYAKNDSQEITKAELSDEVAGCYIAHKRARTDFYNKGDAEIYKEIIAQLSGKQNVNKIINIAARKQTGAPALEGSLGINPKIYASKYCTEIEEKLLSLMVD